MGPDYSVTVFLFNSRICIDFPKYHAGHTTQNLCNIAL